MKTDLSWQIEHRKIINNFLLYLNNKSEDFILKEGTALLLCYGLDRFSEDIYLDGLRGSCEKYIILFCELNNFSYRVAKDTATTKRYMLNYGNDSKPLKIEISYRRKIKITKFKTNENDDSICIINNIKVYSIDTLCNLKLTAYAGRDKIRDLYDLSFIIINCSDNLNITTVRSVINSLECKGSDYAEYLINTQEDHLIDGDVIIGMCLTMYSLLGLLEEDEDDGDNDETDRLSLF